MCLYRRCLASSLLLLVALTRVHAESPLSAEQLHERAVHRRAVEAVIWGMPAVNAQLMFDAVEASGAEFNQVVYWSRLINWKNQTLTPNPDTVYIFPFFNTKDAGPMVLEIPPGEQGHSITGSIDDGWQVALADVGPAGTDAGKGGKYLILPPDFSGDTPADCVPLKSNTYAGFVILRSNVRSGSDADVAAAVEYGKRIKFYPLSQAASPPATTFVDIFDKPFDSTIPYDELYFAALDRFVQREPWLERDKAMIDSLRTIGIEQGKPFAPDDTTSRVLADAAQEAHVLLDFQYEKVFSSPFNLDSHWALPASPAVAEAMESDFASRSSYPVDDRAVTYSMAYFSAKKIGTGQFYLMAIVDSEGNPFDGGKSYRLHVPAKAPVKLYWSATVYDRQTHSLIHESVRSSRASNSSGLVANADGSVDVYFGPAAPIGKEANWVPTNAGGRFEVLFRLYGPERPFFDKMWKLPDIERAE